MVSKPPNPPQTLPKYIREGLPKQDKKTLQQAKKYINSLIKYRENLSKEEIQADDGEKIKEIEEKGSRTKVVKKVPCGKDNCSTCPHGPYIYMVHREEGSLVWDYEGPVN